MYISLFAKCRTEGFNGIVFSYIKDIGHIKILVFRVNIQTPKPQSICFSSPRINFHWGPNKLRVNKHSKLHNR